MSRVDRAVESSALVGDESHSQNHVLTPRDEIETNTSNQDKTGDRPEAKRERGKL